MIQQEIKVKVSFAKHTLTKKDTGVVEGDYNTTKLIFEFEEDVSNQEVIFKMSTPEGDIVLMKPLTDNEIVLVGYDTEGKVRSLFEDPGIYPFELVAYGENSKLTSAPGWLTVTKRQIPVEDTEPNPLSQYNIGFVEGRQAEQSDFWDKFQQKGARTCYNGAFIGWTDDMFYPKYDIVLGQLAGVSLGSAAAFVQAKIDNIKTRLEECGVKIFLRSLSVQTMFLGCQTEELPLFDCTGADWISWVSMFQGCTTRNANFKNGTFHYINDPFNNCPNLEEITLEGCRISPNGFNKLRFDLCPKLTKQSILNVFNVLDNIAGSGKVCVITLGANHLAKLTEEEKAIATEKGWTLA